MFLNLAPLLFAGGVPEVIRASVFNDVLGNIFPCDAETIDIILIPSLTNLVCID